ncbi:MAG: hypothetical protein L0219_06845 [Phycisphaerales bacterium]|nr:hypothetical protein [Phycisphaerales bacterium]
MSSALHTRRLKLLMLMSAGMLCGALLLLVVLNIDTPGPAPNPEPDSPPITELIEPGSLTPEDLASGDTDITRPAMLAAQRGNIQAMQNDRLWEYRFEALDPLPNGWSKMRSPSIQAHLADGRILTMKSDSALILMPAKTPESGAMTGNVIIRLYHLEPATAFDPQNQLPAIEVQTQEASFDNFQGEVRCDGRVDIQTASAHVPGSGLRLQINEIEHRPEWLSMAKAGPIRLSNVGSTLNPKPSSTSPQPQTSTDRNPSTRPDRNKHKEKKPKLDVSTPPSSGPDFYLLSLRDNVRVRQGDARTGWTAAGDELNLTFCLQGESLSESLALREHAHRADHVFLPVNRRALPETIAVLAIAAQQTEASSGLYQRAADEITITCDGGLTMTPLPASLPKPSSEDDALLELIGAPVRVHSAAESAVITAATLQYHTKPQLLKLRGAPADPMTIESPELRAAGQNFAFDRLKNIATFDGVGWMILQSAGDASGSPAPPQDDTNVRLDWQDRAELTFAPPAATQVDEDKTHHASLERAQFAGQARIRGPDFDLRADELDARFLPNQADDVASVNKTKIESLHAAGSVQALNPADNFSLACNDLNVDFDPGAPDGRPVPLKMNATGDVLAVDADQQRMWADRLLVVFEPAAQRPAAFDDDTASASNQHNARPKTIEAHDDVQIILADGARVFADRLHADPATEMVTLTGENIMVVSDRLVMHHGDLLKVHGADRHGEWPGPGEYLSYASPILPASQDRLPRPALSKIDAALNPVHLRAGWSDAMIYDGAFNEGAGAVTLLGNVQAESTPKPLELNTLSAESLRLEFVSVDRADAIDNPKAIDNAAAGAGHSRQLKHMIAENQARLESRTWLDPDKSDKPRVFYVSGPSIKYDAQTLEALVLGEGELLVRDDRIPPENAPPENSSFSAKGTTLIRWRESLQMTRLNASTYQITVTDEVQVRHQALDESISKLTAPQLRATVERRSAPANDAFDLGGSMQLKRLQGSGGIYIDTPTRDIDCDQFEYDYASGLANLSALPGRNVAILTKGDPEMFRASSAIWDLVNNRITATDFGGGT